MPGRVGHGWQSEPVTAPARLVAALLALVVAACSVLPWAGDRNAWHIALRSLVTPGLSSETNPGVTIGLVVVVVAAVVLLAVLLNLPVLVLLGGLASVAVPVVWIAVNALAHDGTGLAIGTIRIGAYGCAAAGLMVLVLAASAAGSSRSPVR